MAFDGIMTAAVVRELKENILLGKIDKIYQPEPDELVLNIYTKNGVRRLYSTVNSAAASVRFVDKNPVNPPAPLNFCMLMRKQLLGGRIVAVEQKDSERIIGIFIETMNELEFTVSRKLIFEMMGRHSNIILVDYESGKIVDSIKHVSIDVNRARQLLPGKKYEYPPAQDKKPFKEASPDDLDNAGDNGKAILASIGTAGTPGAGMIMLAMVLQSVGLPVEGIALVAGVDRIFDMGRTGLNVFGDISATMVVSHYEDVREAKQGNRVQEEIPERTSEDESGE